MDYAKVKLVVTDMDGTLLNEHGEVSDQFFQLYKKLKTHQVQFVAASGRQHHSIGSKLSKIKNEIFIIAENGGLTTQGPDELHMAIMDGGHITDLIQLLRAIENAYIVLCGKDFAYIETKDQAFINMFKEFYPKFSIVNDLTKITNDAFFKIAVYHFESSEDFVYPAVKHLENTLQVKVSGKNWLDISHPNANKGLSLKFLQNKLGVSEKETMVFGDYNNDLEMLKLGDFSFAMKNAHPNVIKVANFITKSNNDNGVEAVLEKLLMAKFKLKNQS